MIVAPAAEARDWSLAAGSIVLAVALLLSGHSQSAEAGRRMEFPITVVPQDQFDLGCASDENVADRSCAFDAAGTARFVDRPLQPYTTTYREVVLLNGVFEEPHVREWVQDARRRGDPARVTLSCSGRMLGAVHSVGVRWHNGDVFDPQDDLAVGGVDRCQVATH
jgi:hypothetical protein